ncbi:MAG: zinc ribbon domain-containing protein [Chloroflexi bacterium]|nr:zinc ribbon domain-containing protein [Chloroflexota bacterium]
MPIYEYRCQDCQRKVSLFFRSFSQVGEGICSYCRSTRLTRLISRVALLKPSAQSLEKGPGIEALSDVDADDPRAVREMMRRWKAELGSDAGEEWDEAMSMLDSGKSMEEIERSLSEPQSAAGAGAEEDSADDFEDEESY